MRSATAVTGTSGKGMQCIRERSQAAIKLGPDHNDLCHRWDTGSVDQEEHVRAWRCQVGSNRTPGGEAGGAGRREGERVDELALIEGVGDGRQPNQSAS